jgi:hypothetical protein
MWSIAFNEERGQYRDVAGVGLKHLRDLLSRPDRPQTGSDLKRGGRHAPEGASFQEACDEKALGEVRAKAFDLAEEIEEHRRQGEEAAAARKLVELGEITDYVLAAEKPEAMRRQRRRLGAAPRAAKDFEAAKKAVARVIRLLGDDMPRLAADLKLTISYENPTLTYHPAYDSSCPSPDWVF